LESDVLVTAVKAAFCPVGGAGTIVQPAAANAGLAPITTAVPTTTAAPILERSMAFLSTAWGNGGVPTPDTF
jgi:hypothetical protein